MKDAQNLRRLCRLVALQADVLNARRLLVPDAWTAEDRLLGEALRAARVQLDSAHAILGTRIERLWKEIEKP